MFGIAIFGCDKCGKVLDLSQRREYNDIGLCASCHSFMLDHDKAYKSRKVDVGKEVPRGLNQGKSNGKQQGKW